MNRSTLLVLALPLLAYLMAFFYIPFIVLSYYSFIDAETGRVTLDNYLEIIREPAYFNVVLYSIVLAGETVVLTLILSFPASYYIALHSRGAEKVALLIVMITPFWIDFLLRALAMKNILYLLGFREGYYSMLAAMVYDYLPFMFLPLYASLSRISPSILEAARSLGARDRDLILRIILPMSLPGIIAGFTLVFLMSLTEYVIPSLLGGTKGFTIGTMIYHLFLSGDMWGEGSALTLAITLGLLAASIIVSRRLSRFEAYQA